MIMTHLFPRIEQPPSAPSFIVRAGLCLVLKTKHSFGAAFLASLVAFLGVLAFSLMPNSALASGGSGGGGGVKVLNFSGNWSGSISTSFGTGAFTLKISQSASSLSGSAHFGAPIFDATLKLSAVTLDGIQFSGFVSNGEGSLPITGTLSADGSQISGTVTQLGQVYTYIVFRN